MKECVRKLKDQIEAEIPSAFVDQDQVRASQGWPTGVQQIDDYLIWNGIPKGSLSLFIGQLGQGATSAWIEAATSIISQGKWVAWLNDEAQLFPTPLKQKKVNLNKLLVVEAPQETEKFLWVLQELLSSTMFDLIGCDLSKLKLREHQLQKLKAQARAVQTSVIFLSQNPRTYKSSLYSLILHFKKTEICIKRALHKPTPHSIPRRLSYAQFTLHSSKRINIGIIQPKSLQGDQPESSVFHLASSQQSS